MCLDKWGGCRGPSDQSSSQTVMCCTAVIDESFVHPWDWYHQNTLNSQGSSWSTITIIIWWQLYSRRYKTFLLLVICFFVCTPIEETVSKICLLFSVNTRDYELGHGETKCSHRAVQLEMLLFLHPRNSLVEQGHKVRFFFSCIGAHPECLQRRWAWDAYSVTVDMPPNLTHYSKRSVLLRLYPGRVTASVVVK